MFWGVQRAIGPLVGPGQRPGGGSGAKPLIGGGVNTVTPRTPDIGEGGVDGYVTPINWLR
jgi:hypothetical protein